MPTFSVGTIFLSLFVSLLPPLDIEGHATRDGPPPVGAQGAGNKKPRKTMRFAHAPRTRVRPRHPPL